MLKEHGQPYIAVEADIDAANAARRDGYSVIFGDVARSELVDRLNLGPSQGAGADDGRSGADRAADQARARLGARPNDRRPSSRRGPRRRALQGRRHRRGARNARKLAAIVRSRAGRPRHRDGSGDRLDPRKARRIAQGDQEGGRDGPANRGSGGARRRRRPRPPTPPSPPRPPRHPCRHRVRRPAPCRGARRRPARQARRPPA